MQAFKIVANTEVPEAVGETVNLNTYLQGSSYFSAILHNDEVPGRLAGAKAHLQEHFGAWCQARITLSAVECEIEPSDP